MSIGNVGQLAVDLLIANLPLELVGHIYDHDVLPIAGSDAYGVNGRMITSIDGMPDVSYIGCALLTGVLNGCLDNGDDMFPSVRSIPR